MNGSTVSERTFVKRPFVVRADRVGHKIRYRVDSMPDASGLLFALRHAHDRDANAAVIVLLDPRVPLDEIGNVDGTAAKAQLTNVRYFILNNETGYRWEIKCGPSMRITTNPPEN